MNGRIYDPLLGRFLTADPNIQDPVNGQSFNRYSYVLNNPLAYTDPSGYFSFGSIFKSIAKHILGGITFIPGFNSFVANNQFAQIAVQLVSSAFGGPVGAAMASAYITAIKGGSVGDILGSAAITLGTAAAFAGVGDLTAGHFIDGVNNLGQTPQEWFGSTNHLLNVVGHAAVGCASSAAGGGSCQAGALSAGAGAALGPATMGAGFVGGLVATAAIGGTASVIGGGKFANGAVTASYGYLFNFCAYNGCSDRAFRYADAFAQGQVGKGAAVTDVDPNTLDWDRARLSYDKSTNTFRAEWSQNTQSGIVFGTLDKISLSNGAISIPPDRYDFDMKNPVANQTGFWPTLGRNVLTIGSRIAQGPSYTPYDVHFRQNVKVSDSLNERLEALRKGK